MFVIWDFHFDILRFKKIKSVKYFYAYMKDAKNMYRLSCFLFIGILFSSVWPAVLWSLNDTGETIPHLTASVEQDSVRVGDIVTLTIGYCLPEEARLPEKLEIKGIEGLTLVDRQTGPGGRIKLRFLVDRLDTWKTGAISISFLDKEGETQVLTTDPISLTVSSVLGEKPAEAELRPIQGIIFTSPLWLKYLPWIAGLLCVSFIGFGLFWWYNRRHGKRPPTIPVDPPHIRAGKEIKELEARRLFESGDIKGFYFSFSEIIRRYLASIRDLSAMEFTTEEIAIRMDREQDRKVLPLLRQADLVKFADAVPAPARKEEEVKTALSYIRETSPVPKTDNETDSSMKANQ